MTTRQGLEGRLAARLGSATEARWLADEVLGRRSAPGAEVTGSAAAAVWALAMRRLAGEPLQYVVGTWPFRTVDLRVDRRALIPRPETEQVVEVALGELRALGAGRRPVVADLGTGSGAIALALAAELVATHPSLEVWAADADRGALSLARDNLERVADAHPGVAGRVHLVAGSWFAALPADRRGQLDLVVANPPYVSHAEWEGLDQEVRREPYRALVAGPASDGTPGMAAVEEVLGGAGEWLAPQGAVVVELAPDQAPAAASLARRLGYRAVSVAPDLAGRPRAVVGRTA